MAGREQGSFAYSPESQPGGSAAQSSGSSAQSTEAFRASPVQPHYAAPLASRDHVAAGFLALLLALSAFISSIWATMPKVSRCSPSLLSVAFSLSEWQRGLFGLSRR